MTTPKHRHQQGVARQDSENGTEPTEKRIKDQICKDHHHQDQNMDRNPGAETPHQEHAMGFNKHD